MGSVGHQLRIPITQAVTSPVFRAPPEKGKAQGDDMMGLRKNDEMRLKRMLKRRKTWTKKDESKLKKMKSNFGERRYLYFRLWFSDNNQILQGHPEGKRYMTIRVQEKAKGKLKRVM